MKKYWITLLCCSFFIPLFAQENLPRAEISAKKSDIVIDGNLDDKAWQSATLIELTQLPFGHVDLEAYWKNRQSIVYVTYDRDFLYLGFKCQDDRVFTVGKAHDDLLEKGDAVEIFIDGYGDQRQFFEIQIDPQSLVRDVNYISTAKDIACDKNGVLLNLSTDMWSYDSYNLKGLQVKSQIFAKDGYWSTEIAIPAKELLRRKGLKKFSANLVIRANFVRCDYDINRNFKARKWSSTISGRPHRSPHRMGYIILKP